MWALGPKSLCLSLPHTPPPPPIVTQTKGFLVSQPGRHPCDQMVEGPGQDGGREITGSEKTPPPFGNYDTPPELRDFKLLLPLISISNGEGGGGWGTHLHIKGLWKWKPRRCGDTKAEPPGRQIWSQNTRMGATQGQRKTGDQTGQARQTFEREAPAFPSLKAQIYECWHQTRMWPQRN